MDKIDIERIINYKTPIINIIDSKKEIKKAFKYLLTSSNFKKKLNKNTKKRNKKYIAKYIYDKINEGIIYYYGDELEEDELEEEIKNKIINGNILNVFRTYIYSYKEMLLPLLINIFKCIKNDSKYKLFTEIYNDDIVINGNLNNVLEELKTLRPIKVTEDLKFISDKGYLQIYRGEGCISQHVKDGHVFSWSLNKKIAKNFAIGRSARGIVYTAKININNVAAYITNRRENEIVCLLKDIKIINKESFVNDDVFIDKNKIKEIYKESKYLRTSFIEQKNKC